MSVLFYDGVDHMIEKITTLIKGKANNSHTHTKNDITDFPTLGTASSKDVASSGNASATQVVMGNDTRLSDARKASDVSAWAKASTKPSYTKSEIGLGNVDNTSDSSKPVSTAQQDAINAAYANANKYTDKKVADLIGSAPETMDTLEEVAAAIQENKDVETALNEAIGKKANQTELDTHTGNSTIHITASERTNWNAAKTHADSAHARTDATKVEKSTTNGNIKINGTETTVYTHPSGTNPHGTTKADIGLKNVGNFKAVSTVASQGLTDIEKANARTNISASEVGHKHTKSEITDFPTSMPANGGNASTVNGHTVESNVPANAKFTDTDTWRPQPDWNATSGDAVIKNKPASLPANGGNADHATRLVCAETRPTSANKASSSDRVGMMEMFIASSSMKTGKPDSDAKILQMNWDNTSGWDSQLAMLNDGTLQHRSMSSGTWKKWKTVLDSSNWEKLCNMEDGDFTPNFYDYSNTKQTFDIITAYYKRVKNLCYINIYAAVTEQGKNSTTQYIDGLPFVPSDTIHPTNIPSHIVGNILINGEPCFVNVPQSHGQLKTKSAINGSLLVEGFYSI